MSIPFAIDHRWSLSVDAKPALLEALEQVFGTPFQLFRSDDAEAPLEEIACLIGHRHDESETGSDKRLFTCSVPQLAEVPGGAVFCLPDARIVLALHIDQPGPASAATAAIVPQAEPELIGSCVNTAFKLEEARTNVSQYGNRLTSYAEQLSDCYEELVWLRDLGTKVTHCQINRSLSEVAALILAELRDLIRAETVALIQLPPDSETAPSAAMTVNSLCGNAELLKDENKNRFRQFITSSLALCRSQPLVRNQASTDQLIEGLPEVHSLIIVPVSVGESSFGWVLALNRSLDQVPGHTDQSGFLGGDEFGTVEATLVETAAAMLSTHGRNSQLFQEKEELTLGVVKSLVRSLEARDAYTCGHSDRVALISSILAGELGYDEKARYQIYITGLLHDVGKVGIPDGILNKPDRLTDEEFDVIKKHPVIGYDILKDLKQFSFVLPAVRHHHEQMNGRGYPDGLSGENIPLDARIMAVADAYDAMTSSRPYRDGMPFEKAESILKENRGPQWDPQVLDAFFRCRVKIEALCRKHKMTSLMNQLPPSEPQNHKHTDY